jgi:hypothetical protein
MMPITKGLIGFALACAVPVALAQSALDGRKFVGEIGAKGGEAEERDVQFVFSDGMFRSSVCDKYGFEKGAYTTAKEGEVIRFEAQTVSAEHGTNRWNGIVRHGVLEGVLVWQRKPSFFRRNPAPEEKWFRAKLM